MLIGQAFRYLYALFPDLLALWRFYETQNGDECTEETSGAEFNCFCTETVRIMTRFIDDLSDFFVKVDQMVGWWNHRLCTCTVLSKFGK